MGMTSRRQSIYGLGEAKVAPAHPSASAEEPAAGLAEPRGGGDWGAARTGSAGVLWGHGSSQPGTWVV